MSVLTAFAIMGLVLLGIVLLCLAVTRMEKTAKSSEYDERQQLVRGRGYRLAFWVGFVILLIIGTMMVGQVDGKKTVEPYLLVYGGFFIQNLVFHIYCVLNHAELPLSQRPVGTILVFLFSGIIWIMTFFNAQRRYPLALVGYGSEGWMYLIVSFTFLSMALMHLIQLLRQKRNERIEGKE